MAADFTKPEDVGIKAGGTGRWGDFPAYTREMYQRIARLFIGTTAPTGTEIAGTGQLFLDSTTTPNRLKAYNGSAFADAETFIFPFSEVAAARGTAADLAARLGISLNPDGTLKASTTLNPSQWVTASGALVRVSASTFTIAGDQTAVFLVNRRVLFTPSGLGTIISRSFGGGVTTVTIAETTVPVGLSSVSYGIVSPDLAGSALTAKNIAAVAGGVVEDYLTSVSASQASVVYAAAGGFSTGASGAANRSALQAANDVLSNGGVIVMPPGTFTMDTTPLLLSRSIKLVGAGMAATVLRRSDASTNPVIRITRGGVIDDTPGSACVLEDFQINMTGTSAVGVEIDPGTTLVNEFTRINRVRFTSGAGAISVVRALRLDITHCAFIGQTGNTIRLQNISNPPTSADQGVYLIAFNDFEGPGTGGCAVNWTSGGGLRFIGNGGNSYAQGILCSFDAGTASGGAQIIGNDFGAQFPGGAVIQFEGTASGAGSGAYGDIYITGNHFVGAQHAIRIAHAIVNAFVGITIVGNTLGVQDNSGSAIVILLDGVHGALVSDNFLYAQVGTSQHLFSCGNSQKVNLAHLRWQATGSTLFLGTTYTVDITAPGLTSAALLAWENGSRVYVTNIKNTGDSGYTAGAISSTAPATGNYAYRLNNAWRTG